MCSNLKGVISVLLISGNTIFWFPFILLVSLLKLLIPIPQWKSFTTAILSWISETWTAINNFNISWFIKFNISGTIPAGLKRDGNYLLISNHQSWTDIIILQKLFNRKIPFFRFFLKKELIYIPFLGLAWWALDYPFMKRYSKSQILKNPSLKGKDLEITRRACEKYGTTPVAIVIFPEGTRYTDRKHEKQNSPYKHLLNPKAGGMSYVLYAIGKRIDSIINVTLVYPGEEPSFWKFLCGKLKDPIVKIETLDVTDNIIGNYSEDPRFRKEFQNWINGLWKEKDMQIKEREEQ